MRAESHEVLYAEFQNRRQEANELKVQSLGRVTHFRQCELGRFPRKAQRCQIKL